MYVYATFYSSICSKISLAYNVELFKRSPFCQDIFPHADMYSCYLFRSILTLGLFYRQGWLGRFCKWILQFEEQEPVSSWDQRIVNHFWFHSVQQDGIDFKCFLVADAFVSYREEDILQRLFLLLNLIDVNFQLTSFYYVGIPQKAFLCSLFPSDFLSFQETISIFLSELDYFQNVWLF